jgi:hypothetical protein
MPTLQVIWQSLVSTLLTEATFPLAVLHVSSLPSHILAVDVGEGVVVVALSITIPPPGPHVKFVLNQVIQLPNATTVLITPTKLTQPPL